MMKRFLIFIFVGVTWVGCSEKNTQTELPEDVQTISLLGDTLRTLPAQLPAALSQRIDSLIEASDDTARLIWQGRKAAYQGDYRQAVEIFTDGIKQFQDEPRFYRHRGHRYITLRMFDEAENDLEKAADLIDETEDRVEPDGLPNPQNKPRSTLHTNIYYHLGLAHYLQGDFEDAAGAFADCLRAADNDDMLVAALYWYYMSLRRDGQDILASAVIEPIREDMDVIENHTYHVLLLVFKGVFSETALLESVDGGLENATIGYGLGNWHFINGREERAHSIWREVYKGELWAAFGYIASEFELADK